MLHERPWLLQWEKVHLNEVGDYVMFPSLWWHHGYYDIQSEDKVIFTAQSFATPGSNIGSTKHSLQNTSVMTSYVQGQFDSSQLNGLTKDLFNCYHERLKAHRNTLIMTSYVKVNLIHPSWMAWLKTCSFIGMQSTLQRSFPHQQNYLGRLTKPATATSAMTK